MQMPFTLSAIAGAGSGGPVLPQIPSLVARFSATDITPQADNTSLVTWTDSIGGIVATQATGANQPKYRTAGINGKPCIEFGGSAWLPLTASNAIKTAMDAKSYTLMVITDQVAATAFGAMFGASNAAAGHLHVANATRVGRYGGNLTSFAAPNTASGFTVYCNTVDSAWSAQITQVERFYLQGTCFASNANPALILTTSATAAIGARDLTGVLPFKGRIHDILVWNRALTPAEVALAHKWACAKYAQALPWAGVNRMLAISGNSLSASVGSTDMVGGYPYKLATANSLTWGQWSCLAVGGVNMNTLSTKTAEITDMIAATGKNLVAVGFEWTNDQNAYAASVIWDHTVAYANAIKAVTGTKLVLGSSISLSTDPNANRIAFNALFDSGAAAVCDAPVALHTDTSIGNTSAYATNSAAYWSEILHLNPAGQTIQQGLFQPAVSAQLAS